MAFKQAIITSNKLFSVILKKLWSSFANLIPIIIVITFFQAVVLREPLPDLGSILLGGLLVVIGLSLFVQGLKMGLFPIGEGMAHALARKGSVFWLLSFSFLLGFATTIAEPALIVVAGEAADTAAKSGLIGYDQESRSSYAWGIRLSVALSVGLAILIGVLRILRGWPLHYLVIGGYVMVMLVTTVAPKEIIGLAYDAGGVTTSTVTVPLIVALGVGLASTIKGRNPVLDGFGLIALASLMPIIFVIGYGLIVFGLPD